jgi:hypothetical protein
VKPCEFIAGLRVFGGRSSTGGIPQARPTDKIIAVELLIAAVTPDSRAVMVRATVLIQVKIPV